MHLDFDQVPQWFISTSLTNNQRDTITIKYHCYKFIDPNKNILEQCREIADELIKHDICLSPEGIRKYYYKNK